MAPDRMQDDSPLDRAAPMTDPAALLRRLFDAAVDRARPARCLPPFLPSPPRGRTVAIGAGKAAAAMARTVADHWEGSLTGLVVTRYGHADGDAGPINVAEAGHPVPDAAGIAATERMLALVADLGPDDLVLCLLSGGGSALMAHPAPGLTLADKQAVARALLASGAPIADMNTVRRHLSAVKGGRLALACRPAPVVTLALSDVTGDDPRAIASGPTVGDPTTPAEARAILDRLGITPPPAVAAHLAAAGPPPAPGDPRLADAEYRLVAGNADSLRAAAEAARAAGVTPVILGDTITGEARDAARTHAAIARWIARGDDPAWPAPPVVLLSGGETTVTVRGPGRGGRNGEFLLGLALALDGAPGIHALAADTDGIDGSESNAGALVAPDSLDRARAAGRDPAADLAGNDAFGFFQALGDLVTTGPTRTNVNDFRAILIDRPRP